MGKKKPKSDNVTANVRLPIDLECSSFDQKIDIAFQDGVSMACSFSPSIFSSVMHNLIKNPNITSSHLFRADILYDSENDPSFAPLHNPQGWDTGTVEVCKLARHMKQRYRPRPVNIKGWQMTRLIVREMIPRNPKIDEPLPQTCCFYERIGKRHNEQDEAGDVTSGRLSDQCGEHENGEPAGQYCVMYIPHVSKESEVPYYHPEVNALAFIYDYRPAAAGRDMTMLQSDQETDTQHSGILSIHPSLFPTSQVQTERLNRVFINLITTIERHGRGRLAGYTKRVNHDAIISQQRFQNTYTRLKMKYASQLARDWREVTDPLKHVFEDLGIAAFLVELWRDMYGVDPEADEAMKKQQMQAGEFSEFVDIGCGNGVLVAILAWEGYAGWGFDIRRRKSWDGFEEHESVKGKLKEIVLVPKAFEGSDGAAEGTHNGVFKPGTFIISNHADELTPWTPLLAEHSQHAPFLAIPCCSHDLSGARTRFPQQKKRNDSDDRGRSTSAYQTLCDNVERLSIDVGYDAKREYLRIPSTRNVGILGTPKGFKWHSSQKQDDTVDVDAGTSCMSEDQLESLISREMRGHSIPMIAAAWRERASKLRNSKGDPGH